MKSNKIIWFVAIILVIISILVSKNYDKNKSLLSQQDNTKSIKNESYNSHANNNAIDFTLTDLDGNQVTLSSLRGKNVYLNFWATWCPPCRREMPGIEKVYQQYKDKDLVILAINVGENADTVKDFMKSNNYNFKVLLDSNQSIAEKYNISAIPVSYFIDKSGNIKYKKVGVMDEDEINSNITNLFTE